MKRFLICLFALLGIHHSALSQAYGDLPPNPIGIVNYTTPGSYVNYNYSFTASTTGVDYFGVAIRQDPGYWGIGNFDLTRAGNSTNLLLNPNLQYGGTTNTQYGLQAPADWGIWYQSGNGAPPAAGMYYAPGQGWMGTYTGGLGVNTSTAGTWIDGAVGTFDGIYQGINVTAGTTYNFSFSLNGTQSSSNPSIEIGAYAGACAAGTSPFTCTPSSSSGFTAAATPAQTQGTGGAPPPTSDSGSSEPTVVSTQNTTIITTSVINGTTYTYNQPVIITTYSDGSTTTTNNGSATLISTTLTGGGTGITSNQQSDVTNFNNNVIRGNGIYIQQSGNNDTINIQQVGTQNLIGGINQQYAQVQNGNNSITIKQGNGNTGKNEIDLNVTGGSNTLNLTQGWDTAGISAGNNYQLINVNGTGNSITTSQSNDGGAVGHFLEAVVNGNYNTVGITQSNDGQKQMFASITGNSNTVTTTQSGTGNHYLSVSATGNGNSAVVSQTGNTANSATINLINNGAPASVNLTQTGGQAYSITQSCVTTCGTITVRQGN